jgi:hypothetical protein
MGTSPRSWSSRRVTSLAAAALGAALTAAFVARRRAPSRPVRPLIRGGSQPEEQPADALGEARAVAGPPPVTSEPDTGPSPATGEPDTGPPPVEDEPDTAPSQPAGGRRRTRAVAVGLALLVALGVGLGLVVFGRDDQQPGAAEVETTETTSREPTTTTAIDDVSPQDAFAHAADRLASSGSFGYVGTTSAIDVSHVRPGLWLAVDVTVEGQVLTSADRVHEIAVDGSGGASETVTEGPTVWGRVATSREALAGASYLPITEESGVDPAGKGVALLPTWLESTVDRRDAGTDELGHRVLRATLPASVLGEIVDGRPADDADVVLTLDTAGDPVHVEITSVPPAPPLRLSLDLIGIGEPVLIDLPAQ